MLDSVLTQLQRTLYDSIFAKLQNTLTGNHSKGTAGGNFTAHASNFDALFTQVAQKYNLEPSLLKAVAHAESNFSPDAISRAGAKGIMQLTDTTAAGLGVTNVFDPLQNIEGGAKYLRAMLDRYDGDVSLALAAYNAGPGAVDRWGGLPPYQETQAYIPRVLNLRDQYQQREWTA